MFTTVREVKTARVLKEESEQKAATLSYFLAAVNMSLESRAAGSGDTLVACECSQTSIIVDKTRPRIEA